MEIRGCVKVMCVYGIFMSLGGLMLTDSPVAITMLFLLPVAFLVPFAIKGHPAFGIAYTVLFFLERAFILFYSTLLAKIIVLASLAFFIYVDCVSLQEWKAYKKRTKELEDYIHESQQSK